MLNVPSHLVFDGLVPFFSLTPTSSPSVLILCLPLLGAGDPYINNSYPNESQSQINPRSNPWRVRELGAGDTVEECLANHCPDVSSHCLRITCYNQWRRVFIEKL